MEACGAYWPEAHTDPDKIAKLAWAAYEFAGLEGVRAPFYIYAEAVACGATLTKWKKNNQPVLEKPAISTLEDIDKLEIPDPKRDGHMPAILKAVEILAPKCEKENLPLILTVIAPMTLSLNAGLTDTMYSMIWFKKNPAEMEKLMQKCLEIGVVYAEALVDRGVHTIFYNGALDASISPKDYEGVPLKYNVEGVRRIKELGAYVVYHSCMDIKPVFPLLPKLNAHAISLSQEMDMKEAREIAGEDVIIAGNVSPTFTLIKRGPKEVIAEAKYCIDNGTDILCPGCGYGPKTPLENMKAMVEAGKTYGHNARLARK
ncbi:MAG: methylcobamide:CoM methyltransferase [Candidatus Syntrophoarchaeum sp. GoM_oil]|nr:MAG: methylcobamide:CoM methyltransferase [Candidatus Syntrophoarchaeum sp. GoM_oil]